MNWFEVDIVFFFCKKILLLFLVYRGYFIGFGNFFCILVYIFVFEELWVVVFSGESWRFGWKKTDVNLIFIGFGNIGLFVVMGG